MVSSFPALPGVLFVRVPVRLHRIVRSVVYRDHHGVLVGNRRSVHVAFGIAVEAAGAEHDAGAGVFVSARQANHELVGWMIMRGRNSSTLREADQRDRG